MGGSQKLLQRLLSTIRERLAAGLPIPALALALAVAAWTRYAEGVDEAGGAIDVRDPMAALFCAALAQAGEAPAARVAALLAVEPAFGTDLPAHPGFVAAASGAYETLLAAGALAAAAH